MKSKFPFSINLDSSKGASFVDDVSGSSYLDFFSMYSSLALGYNHPIFDQEFSRKVNQFAKMRLATNFCHYPEVEELESNLSRSCFTDAFHFTCTGALAVESALKTAMYCKPVETPMVISVNNSFHGVASWGFTTDLVSGTAERLKNMPRLEWPALSLEGIIQFIETEDTSNLVAVIVEPVQCTNGDIYLEQANLLRIYDLCKQHNICFILDEIQTGFGTTGKMWYYEHLGFVPDILVFGKKAQICGIAIGGKYQAILDSPVKTLQVTFDGDLIDVLRANYIFKAFKSLNLLSNVNLFSELIRHHLSPLTFNYRSVGYLIAFDFEDKDKRDVFVQNCLENFLLINSAGERTVRIRPNLAVSEFEVMKMIEVVKKCL